MTDVAVDLARRIEGVLTAHPPETTDRLEFLRARFAAGLAWVHYPEGLGGLGLDARYQPDVDAVFAAAGAPDNRPHGNVIGLGMAAPTVLRYATPEQQQRWIPPLWTGEEIWCQLFSEPGAGSDLAAAGASARRDGDAWVVNGQKVWTSLAHDARWALLLVRTGPTLPKHQGLSYFVLDLTTPGVDVRSLRQLTGEAEFNEVFLDDVRVPDENRLGEIGEGWKVTQATLMNERVAIGGGAGTRESGPIGDVVRLWRESPQARRPENFDALLRLWTDAEALRLTGARLGQQLEVGAPGPEGSGLKLAFAELAQAAASLQLDLLGSEALRYDDWSLRRPDFSSPPDRVAGYWYLRNRANSIEGGTSEIMRNIISERVLGLPSEPRVDTDIPWKDLPK
ncbi:acyl-CoA dehydrogenase [Nocardioides immobilis]|uniref:Acyl-CoA dehydrogenase n=2 Tax=Nocardioides immobilis TaxID=2049295 RepID=A0A417Y6K0_9ACTN|nr:acyl-CoA dehydrogenase [Nocardioides immobilis]